LSETAAAASSSGNDKLAGIASIMACMTPGAGDHWYEYLFTLFPSGQRHFVHPQQQQQQVDGCSGGGEGSSGQQCSAHMATGTSSSHDGGGSSSSHDGGGSSSSHDGGNRSCNSSSSSLTGSID
jgi:hypothetical protein